MPSKISSAPSSVTVVVGQYKLPLHPVNVATSELIRELLIGEHGPLVNLFKAMAAQQPQADLNVQAILSEVASRPDLLSTIQNIARSALNRRPTVKEWARLHELDDVDAANIEDESGVFLGNRFFNAYLAEELLPSQVIEIAAIAIKSSNIVENVGKAVATLLTALSSEQTEGEAS
jgi:hypothetical protein